MGLAIRSARLDELHRKLFALFGPSRHTPLPAEQAEELRRQQQAAWQAVQKSPEIQTILIFLGWLPLLTAAPVFWIDHLWLAKQPMEPRPLRRQACAAISEYLRGAQRASGARSRSLADLDTTQAQGLMDLLLQSPLSLHRRIACGLRIFYIRCIYQGKMGKLVANISDFGEGLLEADLSIPPSSWQSPLHYDSKRHCIAGDIDYLVVGSGPAGCVVAHELHSAGKRVLVLESGPFFMPGTFDGRAGLDFYENQGYRSTMDGSIFVLNGAVVGGGATVNVDMAFPPSVPSVRHRFEQWRQSGQIPEDFWTPEELEQAHAWVVGRFCTRQLEADEINRHNRILQDGARAHGRSPSLYCLNTHMPGRSPYARTDKIGPVEALLMPALADVRNPCTLMPNARANRILFEGGRAVGVEFNVQAQTPRAGLQPDPCGLRLPQQTPIRVYAKNVILSGGTLGSCSILLRSGVTRKPVGRGFVMHPFMLVFGLFNEDVCCHVGTPSSVYVGDYLATAATANAGADFLIESSSARPEIGALLLPGSGDQVYRTISQYRRLGGIGVLLIDSVNPANRVAIDRKGRPEVYYALTESDKQRFRFGMMEGIRIMLKAGAEKVILPTHERLPMPGSAGSMPCITDIRHAESSAGAIDFTPNKTPLFAAHIMAGNKLGVDPADSVISPEHRVWGTKNLYVVDNSMFPGSVGANPMQTIYAAAKVFCDRHLARFG